MFFTLSFGMSKNMCKLPHVLFFWEILLEQTLLWRNEHWYIQSVPILYQILYFFQIMGCNYFYLSRTRLLAFYYFTIAVAQIKKGFFLLSQAYRAVPIFSYKQRQSLLNVFFLQPLCCNLEFFLLNLRTFVWLLKLTHLAGRTI